MTKRAQEKTTSDEEKMGHALTQAQMGLQGSSISSCRDRLMHGHL